MHLVITTNTHSSHVTSLPLIGKIKSISFQINAKEQSFSKSADLNALDKSGLTLDCAFRLTLVQNCKLCPVPRYISIIGND